MLKVDHSWWRLLFSLFCVHSFSSCSCPSSIYCSTGDMWPHMEFLVIKTRPQWHLHVLCNGKLVSQKKTFDTVTPYGQSLSHNLWFEKKLPICLCSLVLELPHWCWGMNILVIKTSAGQFLFALYCPG